MSLLHIPVIKCNKPSCLIATKQWEWPAVLLAKAHGKEKKHQCMSPGMLHIVGYLSPVLQITKPFELSSHVPVWVFLKEFVCFLFLRITEVMSLKKTKPKSLSISLYWIKLQRAVQQFHSITLTNVHIWQQWILHPQKLGLYFKPPPLTQLHMRLCSAQLSWSLLEC